MLQSGHSFAVSASRSIWVPPQPEEVEAFVSDNDPAAYDQLACWSAFGRRATGEERLELRACAGSVGKLAGLCRILYNASGFVYVD